MCSIGYVIYGVKIDEALLERSRRHNANYPECFLEDLGFKILYSASGPPVGFFGVVLDTVLDGVNLRVSTLKLEPTDEQSISVWTDLRALKSKHGLEFSDDDVDVWLVWSSS